MGFEIAKGVVLYHNGDRNEGEWHGISIETKFPVMDACIMRHGFGKFNDSDGYRDTGEWKNDKPRNFIIL